MNSALLMAADRIKQDEEFLVQLLDGLTPYTVTNIARGRMINEGNKALQYTMEEMISLPGEHTTGEDGFVEFHPDQEALMQLVLQLFYEPVNL